MLLLTVLSKVFLGRENLQKKFAFQGLSWVDKKGFLTNLRYF